MPGKMKLAPLDINSCPSLMSAITVACADHQAGSVVMAEVYNRANVLNNTERLNSFNSRHPSVNPIYGGGTRKWADQALCVMFSLRVHPATATAYQASTATTYPAAPTQGSNSAFDHIGADKCEVVTKVLNDTVVDCAITYKSGDLSAIPSNIEKIIRGVVDGCPGIAAEPIIDTVSVGTNSIYISGYIFASPMWP